MGAHVTFHMRVTHATRIHARFPIVTDRSMLMEIINASARILIGGRQSREGIGEIKMQARTGGHMACLRRWFNRTKMRVTSSGGRDRTVFPDCVCFSFFLPRTNYRYRGRRAKAR